MRRLRVFLVTVGTLLLVSGCALAPTYSRPESPVPPQLPADHAVVGQPAAEVAWQEFIGDPRLRSVVSLVLANNRDLRAAALNTETVAAQYRIQRAQLLPTAGASANLDAYRVPDTVASDGKGYSVAEYTIGGFASWEIDVFGRIRSLRDQALNQYLANQQVEVATRTSLIAATASAYYALAADSENLGLGEATREAQQRTLELIQGSRAAGIASDLDVQQARTLVESARVETARYAGLVELDRHALELLAGAPVPPELLPAGLGQVQPLKAVSAGLPSEVLVRRPDVLAAEYQLKAANANIGAARAAYLPRISLTGALGLLSTSLSDLFTGGAGTYSFTPQVTAPIFTGGARKATTDAARLSRDAAIAQYEKAIQVAFREASDALSLRKTLTTQRGAAESLVSALGETYRLSDARYKAGIDGYLGVLVAQRELFRAQQALVGVRLAEQQNLVNLYKVLGGGV